MADIGGNVWGAFLAEVRDEVERGPLLWTGRDGRRCYRQPGADGSTLTVLGGGRPEVVYVLVGVDDAALS